MDLPNAKYFVLGRLRGIPEEESVPVAAAGD
jgi:hypothetical protein